MMWQSFMIAFCLVLVIEGILPFLVPHAWRNAMQIATQMNDKNLRIMGFVSMLLGTIMLYIIH